MTQMQSINVALGEIVTVGGAVTYYTFIIPEAASNPRLVGHYEVADGQTIRVKVLEQEGCPSPLSSSACISIYSTPNKDRGDVNIGLTPGKTYYLEFLNDGFELPKTTQVNFKIEYDWKSGVP